MVNKIALAISTWFGCGYAPKAPGTAGSLAAAALAALLWWAFGWHPWAFGVLGAVTCVPAIWAAGVVVRSTGVKDPQFVVSDEVVGTWIALAGASHLTWISLAAGFGLFRLFDIWKPYPVRQLERLPGGWGIVADDVGAGFYAALVLIIAGWFNLY